MDVVLASVGAAAESASLPEDVLGVVVDVVFLALPELVIGALSSRLLLRFLLFAMRNILAGNEVCLMFKWKLSTN